MALPSSFPIISPVAPVATGIVVSVVPTDPTAAAFEMELQRAPDSGGAPGTPVTIARLAPAPISGAFYTDRLPVNGALFYYRFRHVRQGWTAGAYGPWSRAGTAKFLDGSNLPAAIPIPFNPIPAIADGTIAPGSLSPDATTTFGPSGREELTVNGDFESGLAYWGPDSISAGTLSIETGADRYKGVKSAKISNIPTTGASRAFAMSVSAVDANNNPTDDTNTLKIRVQPGDKLRVRTAFKASVSQVTGAVDIIQYDDNKAFVSLSNAGPGFATGTTSWQEKETIYTVPAGTYYLSFLLLANGSAGVGGTAWFDEFHVWRVKQSADISLGYFDNGTKASNFTIDWVNGDHQRVTLGATPLTITLSNPISGKRYILDLVQDGTGSRTVTWPGAVKWPAGTAPTLTTTANRVDQIELFYNGTSTDYRGTFALNFVD